MPSYTIYAAGTGDSVGSSGTNYTSVRAGNSLAAAGDPTLMQLGQLAISTTRIIYEFFLSWNMSSVVGVATVATLSLYGNADNSSTDFTMEARSHPWSSGGVTTADWVAGDDLASKPLLASRSTSGFNASGYNAFTSEAALLTAIDLHGTLDMVFNSSRHRAGNNPSGFEAIEFLGDVSGTSQDPKIDITTVELGQPSMKRFGGVAFAAAGPRAQGVSRW